jgi:DNA-binding SARP family transcriptional activator
MGEYTRALASSEEAIARLGSTSGGVELISARLARATSLAYLARIVEARQEAAVATKSAPLGQAVELAIEIGQFEALVGESEHGMPLLDEVRDQIRPDTDTGEQALLTRVLLAVRAGDLDLAMRDASRFSHGAPRSTVAFEARRLIVKALVGVLMGAPRPDDVRQAVALASIQGARLWHRVGVLLQSLGQEQRDPSEEVRRSAEADPTVISILAELALRRMPDLDAAAGAAVQAEAERMPWRWRGPARQLLASGSLEQRLGAGRMLDLIGIHDDIAVLRAASRAIPDPSATALGVSLSRRLAAPVLIEDLGRLRVAVGDRIVDGSEVRRKVLALLSYLATRPRFAATREEVVESLWPDQDPASALNSLNQTVYFLRRVFEPSYREDLSPGYVMQDSEMVWMDTELVSARSRRCLDLIESIGAGTHPEAVIALVNEYRGRFALDFAYEDWTSAYRDSLHSAYLRVVELAVRDDIGGGRFARGIYLAERATEVDPDAEEIHLALVHLYRLSGAHAAAAEKYGQYSAVMRGLGLDPVPLSEIT